MKFIVPANLETKTIDYNVRFMLSDNDIHPKTYEISKVLDTFPLGVIECTLTQTLYNQHTDFVGKDFEYFGDNSVHRVCDFYKSTIKPDEDLDKIELTSGAWTLTNSSEKLYVHGFPQVITAVPKDKNTTATYSWELYIDNENVIKELDDGYEGAINTTFISDYYKYKNGEADSYYLQDYFDISIDEENNTFTIASIDKDLANYIVKIAILDKNGNKFDAVEMEVTI